MLIAGFIALVQTLFLPGFILLRLLKIRSGSRIETCSYVFALSLLVNYLLVSALTTAHSYSKPVLVVFLVLEFLLAAWLLKSQRISLTLPSILDILKDRNIGSNTWQTTLLMAPALAAIISFTVLCFSNLGSVFSLWDDFVSWDPWAMAWAQGQIPVSGLYPQLLPANWSISYVLIESTNVKLFAKAIMPLFALLTMALFFDLFLRSGKLKWLFAAPIYAILLDYFFDREFVASGYVDVPCAFFCVLAVFSAYVISTEKCATRNRFLEFLPLTFACEASICKQGGLYFLGLIGIWFLVRAFKFRRAQFWSYCGLAALLFCFVDFFYINFLLRSGLFGAGNLSYLVTDNHSGRNLHERWNYSISLVSNMHSKIFEPAFWLFTLFAFLGVTTRVGMSALGFVVIPLFIIWAFLFSYDQRFLSIVLPFFALAGGCATEVFLVKFQQFWRNNSTPKRIISIVSLAGALILLTASVFSITLHVPPHVAFKVFRKHVYFQQLCNLWVWPFLAAVIILAGRFSLKFEFRSHFATSAAAAILFFFGLQQTILNTPLLLHNQRERMKEAGNPQINKLIYSAHDAGEFENSPIYTDYLPMKYLPKISRLYLYEDFSNLIQEKQIRKLISDNKASYVLARTACWPNHTVDWLSQSGCQILFDDSGYKLVKLPNRQTADLSFTQQH